MRGKNIEYNIREMKKTEYLILKDFLYEAIFVPEGVLPPDKEVVNLPELQVYTAGFGSTKDDLCLVAEVGDKIVGAVWVRIMDDYGHVDDETLSLAMSLYKEYRNLGIGTDLLMTMLKLLKSKGYEKVSLSVQKSNYAVSMYKKAGFEVIDENEEEYIMICGLCKGK